MDAVLANNLHGLELDARCVEIAVFALALAAWRFPDENGDPLGVRADMPAPQVACCGLKVAAKPGDWAALVPDEAANAAHFAKACAVCTQTLRRRRCWAASSIRAGPAATCSRPDYSLLRELLQQALAAERQPELWDDTSATWDNALTALGLLDAARLLDSATIWS